MTDKILVLAAVVECGGKYLICKRPADKRHGGLWEFPGGKLEEGEDNLAAARRELREELGVDVVRVEPTLHSFDDPDSRFVINFVPTVISGTPICLEHDELQWLELSSMLNLALAPSDRRFVEYSLGQASSVEG